MSLKGYERITEHLISMIEKTGRLPWQKPWASLDDNDPRAPRSLASGKAYRGINRVVLSWAPYDDPRWVTFKGAKAAGGTVKRGERGTPIVFFKWLERENKDTGRKERFPLLKVYSVFNVNAQCEGVELPALPEPVDAPEFARIEAAEAIAQAYRDAGGPPVEHGGASAFYAPAADRVQLPERAAFNKAEEFYSVLFHELGHSTGHESRLGRLKLATFGDHEYSREELCAEFCAAFLCGEAGIASKTVDNSAAYLQHWVKSLRDDPKALIVGAQQAQKAADWILGRRPEDD